MRGLSTALLLLLAACATAPEPVVEPPRPDDLALAIPTVLRAATISVTLGERWRDKIEIRAIRVDRSDPARWVARGGPEFKLEKFDLKATEEIVVSFLPDHEHIVVYARNVDLLARTKGYTHRNENVASATIADEELSVFAR